MRDTKRLSRPSSGGSIGSPKKKLSAGTVTEPVELVRGLGRERGPGMAKFEP